MTAVAADRPTALDLQPGTDVLLVDDGRSPMRPDGTPYVPSGRAALVLFRAAGRPYALRLVSAEELRAEGPAAHPPRDLDAGPRQSALLPITVVIPTANRTDELRRCLMSLADQRHRPHQVLVVDNAPQPDGVITGIAVEVSALTGMEVRVVDEPRPGSSIARNTGLELVTTPLVAFTDDDVLVDRDWTHRLAAAYDADDIACVTGLVMPSELETPAQVLFERYGGFSKGLDVRTWRKERGPNDSVLHPYACGTFGSGNSMSFRTDVLRALGGFDVSLGVGSAARAGADIESFLRVLLYGSAVRYEPAALVWHQHRREHAALARQLESYGSGLTAIGTKHLLPGGSPLSVLRRLPAALAFLLSGASSRNAGRAAGYPRDLVKAERKGALLGPPRYARARLTAAENSLSNAQAALLTSTAANGALGIVFWVVAARLYPAADVGVGAAWTGALLAVAGLGQLSWSSVLQAKLRPGSEGRRLLLLGLSLAVPASALLACVAALLLPSDVTGRGALVPMLILAAPVWAVFAIQDAALLAAGRPWSVAVENAGYGLGKIALLVALAPWASPTALAMAWIVPAALAVVVVVRLLLRGPLRADGGTSEPFAGRALLRFTRNDYLAGLLGWLPVWVLPVLVLSRVSPEAAAVWVTASVVASAPELAAVGVGGALTVHFARSPDPQHVRGSLRRLRLLLVPVALLLVGAEILLSVFGPTYAQAGATVLRLLLLAAVARAVALLACAVLRAQGRMSTLLAVTAPGCLGGVLLATIFVGPYGLVGVAAAMALGQSVSAVLAAVVLAGAASRPRVTS